VALQRKLIPLSNSFALINAAQVVTLAGAARPRTGAEMSELAIVRDGGLLIRDSLIQDVGTSKSVESQIDENCSVVDVGGRVILPGFIDAHTHPVFAGTRVDEFEERSRGATYQEIAARGGGIQSTVNKTRAASIDELFETGRRYADWFLRGGTTTVEAKSGYGLSVEDEIKILRTIRRLDEQTPLRYVPTFLGAHSIPTEYKSRRADYISLIIDEMLPRVAAEKLVEYCDVFCEENVFSTDESWKILSAARCHGMGLRMHADQLSLSGGAKLAAELGTVTADHLEHTNTEGITALKSAGVQPVLLPGSVYALGSSHYPAAREMIDAGLAVVLATDFNPGSSPSPSMTIIHSLAVTHMRMSPAEAITASTINAAYSLNRGHQIGSLEQKKIADLAIYDCSDYRELSYFFGVEHMWRVYASGRVVNE
jgi:imidazolonepropionase